MLYGWCTTEKPKHSAAQRQQQKWHPAPSASLPLKHLMYPWLPVEEQRLIYQEAALPSGLMCTLWQFTSIKCFSICKLFCEMKRPPLSSLFWCVISLSCLVVFLFLHLPKQSRPLLVPHKGVFQLTTIDILCARCIQNNTVLSFGSCF